MSYDQAMNNFNKQNYNRLAPILKKKLKNTLTLYWLYFIQWQHLNIKKKSYKFDLCLYQVLSTC